MAKKFASDVFVPKNPEKYQGKTPIVYRSSWEFSAMTMFDKHPNVLLWQSESIHIPYYNPLAKKWTVYIPDFLVLYVDAKGAQYCEMMEVKPLKETPGHTVTSSKTGRALKVSKRDQASQIINAAKWQAAVAFCAKRGWKFRVVTEESLYSHKRKTK